MISKSSSLESVDDSWIFESLGATLSNFLMYRFAGTSDASESSDVFKSSENEAKNCNPKKEVTKESPKDAITPSERYQFVKNMYSLIVTARAQINKLKAENRLLENRLDANFLTRCPSCLRRFDVRKNMIKPSYVKVLKARNTLELTFDNMERLEEWIQLNSLENNRDGLPVLMEDTKHPTFASTGSLLADVKRQL
uniref:Uncharacterized protein n=1 Tax=Syphacia muris TaxID=451379 RepID=A0A0N5AUD3_9BILA